MSKISIKTKKTREVPVEAADLSGTVALPFWLNPGQGTAKIMYNPWASRQHAHTTHAHLHTAWAEHIHVNFLSGFLQKPAIFDWRDKVVYIVGRGASLEQAKHILEKPRSNPAIFLNHAFMDIQTQPGDFVLMCDSRVAQVPGWQDKVEGLSLLTFPGIPTPILRLPWDDIYGFVFWPKAPLNDWMRRLYPHFPQLDDSQMISVSALHLAAINKAKAAILVGQDYTVDNGDLTYIDHRGKIVKTVKAYAVAAMAVSKMAHLCSHHAGLRVINCSRGLAGVNLFAPPNTKQPGLFEWFEFESLEAVYQQFEV